jgi:gamma-glutamyl:cysteine ligase YbdK (ATP-grasp superfamily)
MIGIPDELIVEGVSRGIVAWLDRHPEVGAQLISKTVEIQNEIITLGEAAQMLGISKGTLAKNFRDYGLEKSTALGHGQPRFFRSQVLEAVRASEKIIRGRQHPESNGHALRGLRVPRRRAPTIPAEVSH